MIRVVFLAQLREQLGVAATDVSPVLIHTMDELKSHLLHQNPSWQGALSNPKILTAVNHEYVKGNPELHDGDEVAFFPPVTGG